MKKYHRYQLISPISGHKIYQSTSINKVADKCYKELKDSGYILNRKDKQFAILNLDTNEPYIFEIKKNVKHINNIVKNTQNGGTLSPADLIEIDQIIVKQLKSMDKNINALTSKVSSLETDLNELKQSKNSNIGTNINNLDETNINNLDDINIDPTSSNKPRDITTKSNDSNIPDNDEPSYKDNVSSKNNSINSINSITKDDIRRSNLKKLENIKSLETKRDLKGCTIM